jgi:hypothetical protein
MCINPAGLDQLEQLDGDRIVLRTSSRSGTMWMSTSIVDSRQPSRTAVAPPVK